MFFNRGKSSDKGDGDVPNSDNDNGTSDDETDDDAAMRALERATARAAAALAAAQRENARLQREREALEAALREREGKSNTSKVARKGPGK